MRGQSFSFGGELCFWCEAKAYKVDGNGAEATFLSIVNVAVAGRSERALASANVKGLGFGASAARARLTDRRKAGSIDGVIFA